MKVFVGVVDEFEEHEPLPGTTLRRQAVLLRNGDAYVRLWTGTCARRLHEVGAEVVVVAADDDCRVRNVVLAN